MSARQLSERETIKMVPPPQAKAENGSTGSHEKSNPRSDPKSDPGNEPRSGPRGVPRTESSPRDKADGPECGEDKRGAS